MVYNEVTFFGQTLISIKTDTVQPETLLSPATAHDGAGNPISGAVASVPGGTFTPGTRDQTAVPAGSVVSGAVVVKGDPDLVSGNVRAGTEIFGVQGAAAVVDTSAGNANAAQIYKGAVAYVDGARVVGSAEIVADGRNLVLPSGLLSAN